MPLPLAPRLATQPRKWLQRYRNSPSSPPGVAQPKRDDRERLAVSSQYSIAPAYNKGPYMVIAKADLKTAGRKV